MILMPLTPRQGISAVASMAMSPSRPLVGTYSAQYLQPGELAEIQVEQDKAGARHVGADGGKEKFERIGAVGPR